jgi:hypothetical protein
MLVLAIVMHRDSDETELSLLRACYKVQLTSG